MTIGFNRESLLSSLTMTVGGLGLFLEPGGLPRGLLEAELMGTTSLTASRGRMRYPPEGGGSGGGGGIIKLLLLLLVLLLLVFGREIMYSPVAEFLPLESGAKLMGLCSEEFLSEGEGRELGARPFSAIGGDVAEC